MGDKKPSLKQETMHIFEVDQLVAEAFYSWEAVSPLQFSKQDSRTVADINISFGWYVFYCFLLDDLFQ